MGRPRTPVLFWCADEEWAADLRCVLTTRLRCLRFVADMTGEEVVAALLVATAGDGCAEAAERLRVAMPELPVMVWDPRGLVKASTAHVVLTDASMAVMMDRLLTLAVFKRGPKKKPVNAVLDGIERSVAA